jgi:hypothetical protein
MGEAVVVRGFGFDYELLLITFSVVLIIAGTVAASEYVVCSAAGYRKIGFPTWRVIFGVGLSALGTLLIQVVGASALPVEGEERLLVVFFCFGLIIGGAFFACIAVLMQVQLTGPKEPRPLPPTIEEGVPSGILEAFQGIEAERSFETGNLWVFRKGSIYILLPKRFFAAIFVKLLGQATAPEKKLSLPFKTMRKTTLDDNIGGFPMAKIRGEFTIPVDAFDLGGEGVEEKYMTGRGIMYLVSRFDVSQLGSVSAPDLSQRFDVTVILKIIEQISREEP